MKIKQILKIRSNFNSLSNKALEIEGCSIELKGDRVYMAGKTGSHSIDFSSSSNERILAHLKGFIQNNN